MERGGGGEILSVITKVHVGCGPHNLLPEWWNVDLRDFKGIDQVMDVTCPWPWVNELHYIYGEHFLEHLSLEEGIQFLRHASHALCVGGKLRLSTPSLEWVLKTRFTFDEEGEKNRLQQTWLINRAFHGWGHKFLYSKAMLADLLQALGFRRIVFREYGESDDPVLQGIEQHGGWRVESGYPTVWIVEAIRPEKGLVVNEQFLEEAELWHMKYVRAGH